jgi:epoxyqueuosine reductase
MIHRKPARDLVMSSQFDRVVRERARELGFGAVGVASAAEPVTTDFRRYEAFVDAGMQGQMQYLERAREARRALDTGAILDGAKSVICVADQYGSPGGDDESGVGRHIARYARGRDYHNHMRKRLRKLAAFVRTLGLGTQARPMCDDAPVLEKAWAARAGIGFVGKNGLLIVPGTGSFVLLGEVVTTLDLTPDPPAKSRCGKCTLCIDACPTAAFEKPFVLDPRRCISYLTVEMQGEIPEDLRGRIGEHLFGCDDCQTACPFNSAPPTNPRPQYATLPRWRDMSLEGLVEIDDRDYERLVEGSPVRRGAQRPLVRNAITILASRRLPRYRALMERAASNHPDGAVRRHALWGLGLLDGSKGAAR